MKLCEYCGTQNADDAAFCRQCGGQIKNQTRNQNAYTNYSYNQQQYNQTFQPEEPNVKSANPVLNLLKNLGSSPLFLAAVIAYTASIIFSIISVSSGSTEIAATVDRMMAEMGVGSYGYDSYYEVLNSISSISGVAYLFGMIPGILTAVGMWMTYASASNKNDGGMKTAGLTIIKVISIISLVLICFVAALLILMFAVVLIVGIDEAEMIAISITLILLLGGIFAFIIVYYAKIISTINTIKKSIITAIPSDRVSGFVAVMCIISGVFNAFSVFAANGFLLVLANLTSAAALILFGAFLFSYKKKMREIMVSSPVGYWPQPPYMQ